MEGLLHTPKTKWTVWFFGLLWLFSEPVVEIAYYETNLRRGTYRANADSIAIPIFEFMFGWLVTLPIVLVFIWFALRSYPGSVSVFAWNAARPIWSFFWSAALLLLAASYG